MRHTKICAESLQEDKIGATFVDVSYGNATCLSSTPQKLYSLFCTHIQMHTLVVHVY